MPETPLAVWSAFLSGVAVAVILLAALVIAIVLYQRRYVNLHRSHARKVLEAQEEERAWVSREVHDDAVQRLALIGRECGAVGDSKPTLSPQQSDRLRGIQAELQDLGAFLRGLAHRLHPALIDRGGLRVALTGLCEELQRSYGLRVETDLPAPSQAIGGGPQRALVVYRIAQEALHNVVKHAGVTTARLELWSSPSSLELMVSDAGRGFDLNGNSRAGGIGLIGMNERAYLAGGKVTIDTKPGAGTRIRASFRFAGEGDT